MASPAWQGYAEADYVKAAPVEQGMLTTISVSRGDRISKGAPLFAQDDTHERAARDQAARQLAQAKSSWPISELQASRQKLRRRRPT
jgi:HlyD family secretion protein